MSENKYTHNLPLNIPLILIILGMIQLPNSIFIGSIHSDASLWTIVLTNRSNFTEAMIMWNYGTLGIDLLFIGLGVWVLLNKDRTKVEKL